MKISTFLPAAALSSLLALVASVQTGCGGMLPQPTPVPAATPTLDQLDPLDLPTGELPPRALPHETCEEFSSGWDRHRCKMFWGLERS